MKAILALEDGTVLVGDGFGAIATRVGEVCFNTSMTGYQEILTDPSYYGQIVTMTYPLIGNYGVNPEDAESWKPHVFGFVVRELSPMYSNWRANQSLPDYCREHGIPGITGIDTRALTKRLRVQGSLRGVLTTESMSPEEAVKLAQESEGIVGADYAKEVTHTKPFVWDESGEQSVEFVLPFGVDSKLPEVSMPAADIPIVAYDFGIKYNILRMLRRTGFRVEVVPAHTTAAEVLEKKPRGIFLSNGPGDPAALGYAVSAIKELSHSGTPLFGICMGHQILSQALGAKTYKLKFGHRGANQPVKDLSTGRVEITSQNHGFAVDPSTLTSDAEVNRINLNDQTVEGLRHKKLPVFSVQYHPEASPGPHDSAPLFQEFRDLIERQ
jgi:carbamoyl-phosphate synthase small subunit